MAYADEDTVRFKTRSISEGLGGDERYEGILQEGLNAADDWINSKVDESKIPDEIPKNLVRAATFYAAKHILDDYYSDEDNRKASAITWEKEAKEYLKDFLASTPEDKKSSTKINIFTVSGPDLEDE
ncbi:MAG: hypothetical protein AMQ22_00076 [Candidatus Methanofastidiosum methylothiophilum]|uniref:DUF1320 domain-containing protein n=1 Tax=Candidatus Methanofastidiosum methylothiophilum TaxID=1705564 RepID=A0A150J9K5_9EURY|nr:MAG: hypothetical protein AMQ22_00076 [Candidatus Methanofastidiosum methylthiophilus]